MAVSAGTLKAPQNGSRALGAVVLGALVVGLGLVAASQPLIDLGLAGILAFVFFPPLCRAVLIGVVAIGPTLNPALFGLGADAGGGVAGGRIYVVQACLVLVIVGAFVYAAYTGHHGEAAAVLGLSVLIVLVETVGRPHAGAAWIYRPLQIFLVAFAVRVLLDRRSHRTLLLALAWGSAIGCALASANAIVPAFDPFKLSRPDNVPFVSAIGSFARATGAFTYPNNLGTFAAYAVLFGASALMFGRPSLPRYLATFLVIAGSSALVLAGSRAAGLGLLCGLLYFTVKLSPRRRTIIVAAEAAVGMVIVLAVLSSPSATEVAQQRVSSATGESLTLRLQGSHDALEAFASSPVVGTGASDARTDDFWLLYLAQGGIVGAVWFVLLARMTLRVGQSDKAYPELWVALLIALCTSGILQDSLGQTLATWFPGALLGLCALRRDPSSDDVPAQTLA